MLHIRSIHIPEVISDKQTTMHYCFMVDVSYSMVGDLPKLREDLKNKIATQVRPGQYITIIYYSSNGQCGYVLSGFYLENATSITTAYNAVDNWLKPIGCTGFVDPLKLALTSVMDFKKQLIESTVVFMSDGYENENREEDVIDACKRLAVHAQACYIVEYGDYANHRLLEKMADTLFGQLIFAGQLPDYNLVIDTVLGTKAMNQITVHPAQDDLAVFVQMGEFIRAWPVKGPDSFTINVDATSEVKMISTNPHDDDMTFVEEASAVVVFFQLGMVELCYNAISQLGDVDVIKKYFGAIGKQRRNQFIDFVRARIANPELLFLSPRDTTYLPHPAEPDLIDLMEVLSSEPGNKLLCRHHLFKYRRGSAAVQTKNEDELKFEEYADQSIDFQSLVLNTSRANISFRGQFKGTVNVSNHPGNPDPARLNIIPTHIFRTYNIVRDGIFVMDKIPVYLTPTTLDALRMLDWYPEPVEPGVWLIDLESMPVANVQRMSDAADGMVFCDKVYAYKVLQAWQKVFRYYQAQVDSKQPSTEWVDKYGVTGSDWLKEIGIHESNGFHPVNTMSIKTDFYYAPVIDVKVTGFNSLPSVADVIKRMEVGKPLRGAVLAMSEAIKAYQALMLKPEGHLRLNEAVKGIVNVKREYENDLAGLVFTSLLSRQPFAGFVENQLTATCAFNESFKVHNDNFIIQQPTEELTFEIVETEEEVSI